MLNAVNWAARLGELTARARVSGATLGIWSDGQEVLAACGVLNSATQVPVTPDSLFQIGSITKIWTATMIMQLIEEGLLALDTTVADALPGIRLRPSPAPPPPRKRRRSLPRPRPRRRVHPALRREPGRAPRHVSRGCRVLLL